MPLKNDGTPCKSSTDYNPWVSTSSSRRLSPQTQIYAASPESQHMHDIIQQKIIYHFSCAVLMKRHLFVVIVSMILILKFWILLLL